MINQVGSKLMSVILGISSPEIVVESILWGGLVRFTCSGIESILWGGLVRFTCMSVCTRHYFILVSPVGTRNYFGYASWNQALFFFILVTPVTNRHYFGYVTLGKYLTLFCYTAVSTRLLVMLVGTGTILLYQSVPGTILGTKHYFVIPESVPQALFWLSRHSIQFNSDICTRQLINYHVGARDEHRKHDPQVGDFKKKSEFSI